MYLSVFAIVLMHLSSHSGREVCIGRARLTRVVHTYSDNDEECDDDDSDNDGNPGDPRLNDATRPIAAVCLW